MLRKQIKKFKRLLKKPKPEFMEFTDRVDFKKLDEILNSKKPPQ